MEKMFVSMGEAAELLCVEREDVETLVADGKVKGITVNGKMRVAVRSLEALACGGLDAETSQNGLDNSAEVRYDWDVDYFLGGKDMSGGNVTHVKNGDRWIAQFDLGKTPDGKRIRKSKSFRTKEEAEDALALELAKLGRTGEAVPDQTFKAVALEFLGKGNPTVEPRTWASYYGVIGYPNKIIGRLKISEITEDTLIDMFGRLRNNHADSMLKRIKTVVGMVLDYAIKKGIVTVNVAKGIKRLPKSTKDVGKVKHERALTKEELQYVLKCAKSDPSVDGIVHLLAYTGMRPGELRALRLEDIDLDKCTVHVRRAASIEKTFDKTGKPTGRSEYIKATKSEYGDRVLSVPRETLEMALAQHGRIVRDRRYYKGKKSTPYLFPGNDGNFMKEQMLQSRWRRFREAYGLSSEVYKPYCFRHTLCTNLILNGTPLPVVQRIMGDNSTDVIVKSYTHIKTEDMAASLGRLHAGMTDGE